jgi:hypothetical protein
MAHGPMGGELRIGGFFDVTIKPYGASSGFAGQESGEGLTGEVSLRACLLLTGEVWCCLWHLDSLLQIVLCVAVRT